MRHRQSPQPYISPIAQLIMPSATRLGMFLFLCLTPILLQAQILDDSEYQGFNNNGTQADRSFNPHNNDTTKHKEVPRGLYVWSIDRFGDITPAEPDTLPHLYPQSTLAIGSTGEYNTVGSNYTARLSRIFVNRALTTQQLFTDVYSQVIKQPEEWHFTNTLSPITNLSYDNCGSKITGEDHLNARFAVNAGKRTGIGFNIDYSYARGYYQNQNISHFASTLYASHLGDRYQLHALFSAYHEKAAESGGIEADNYVTHPELFTESYSDNEIPTVLSRNWNRNHSQRLFLTHRYSLGFYRKVKMTEEEIKARQFAEASAKDNSKTTPDSEIQNTTPSLGRPDNAKIAGDMPANTPQTPDSIANDSVASDSIIAESSRIKVDSKEMADSLLALQAQADSIEKYMKQEFVPVTSFIHTLDLHTSDHIYQAYETPDKYYLDTLFNKSVPKGYPGDSIYDKTKQLSLRNTFAIALLEGFNKYAQAGIKAFATHDLRRFDMPDIDDSGAAYLRRWTEHNVSIGAQLQKAQGTTIHYNLIGETWIAGEDAGQLKLDGQGDMNIRLFGDTVRFAARAHFYRLNPTFLQRRYHSKYLWWDNDMSKETRTRVEGTLTLEKTKTTLKVAIEEIQNYTYLGMNYNLSDDGKRTGLTAKFRQHAGNINILTAQIDQKLRLGPLHWDNTLTYQSSSNKNVLPLPTLNAFSNLYLEFMVAHVLKVELGGSATWFTKYYAPDFLPQINQFAVQENTGSRMELGNFPFVDVYANLHLKHARFFVLMQNALGKDFNKMAFLAPHYPQNRSVLHIGVSWNFFN